MEADRRRDRHGVRGPDAAGDHLLPELSGCPVLHARSQAVDVGVPLRQSLLAFLLVRTDLPGRGWLQPVVLIPIFVSPVVLAFGYVVSVGPVGFFSLWFRQLTGTVPWNLYSLPSLVFIAGLTHIPHVYLYTSSTLRSLSSDLEEAARISGASSWNVALHVSLPMVWPSILFSGVLVFFLGFELFGLPLILEDPEGLLVLTTYLYKLTNRLGVPSYQLMAVVAVSIVAISSRWCTSSATSLGSRTVTSPSVEKVCCSVPSPPGRGVGWGSGRSCSGWW